MTRAEKAIEKLMETQSLDRIILGGHFKDKSELFKWACIRDISGPADDCRPKYLEAVEIAWEMAWERGYTDCCNHVHCYYQVYEELLELNKILKCI